MNRKELGLHEQIAFMKFHWPEFRSRIADRTFVSVGELRPSDASDTYKIEIWQPGGRSPKVRVLTPTLRRRVETEPIPHMYEQKRLCLYLPGTGQWSPEKPIAVTIVPWTLTWLIFYEVWHATGEWLGGGEEPPSGRPYRRDEEED